jgi:thymidylate synthase (FAD)
MRYVRPKVNLVSMTTVRFAGLNDALQRHAGGTEWLEKRFFGAGGDRGSDPENTAEAAGRICYDSFGVGGNPNVTRVREGKIEYFENIFDSNHGSILEHVNFGFIFQDVSRVFSHELVRHRVGTAISQQSGRYVRPTELVIVHDPLFTEQDRRDFEDIEARYLARVDDYDWDSMPFKEKKKVTSMLRKKLPDGITTEVMWTANVRTLRHVVDMRTGEAPEWEIDYVFRQVGNILLEESPALFQKMQYGG